MSKLVGPIELPSDQFVVTANIESNELDGNFYIASARSDELTHNYVAIINENSGSPYLKSVNQTVYGDANAICPLPGSTMGVVGYTPDPSPPFDQDFVTRITYEVLNKIGAPQSQPLVVPDDLKNNIYFTYGTHDLHNGEVYLNALGPSETTSFNGFIIIDDLTHKFSRKITLPQSAFSAIANTRPSISRLRKIYIYDGAELNCINDKTDTVIEEIDLPDVDGKSVDYITGTVVDNVNDTLYVICTHAQETFSPFTVIQKYDVKDNKYIGQSQTLKGFSYLWPLINTKKQHLYLTHGAGGIICIDLKNNIILNEFDLPLDNPSEEISAVTYHSKTGGIGLVTSDAPGVPCKFYMVYNPEQP